MKVSFLIFLLIALFSCNDSVDVSKKHFLVDGKISVKEKMQRILSPEYLAHLHIDSSLHKGLRLFYATRKFYPVLNADSVLSNRGEQLKRSLDRCIRFGIPATRLVPVDPKLHVLEQEILLMGNLSLVQYDLTHGFIDFEHQKLRRKNMDISGLNRLWNQSKTREFDSVLLAQGPVDTNYRFMAQHFFHFCDTAFLDAQSFKIITEKENSEQAFSEMKASLISKKYITDQTDSSSVREALRQFQRNNGLTSDGKIGEATATALSESSLARSLRGAIALDRLRQRKDTLMKFIRINIPSFELYYFANDSLKSHHRIIVGKVSNQTPTLQSKINRIICYPFWKVPSSITRKEILPALKANRNYLARNHMKIFKAKEVEVNPDKINWKKIRVNTFPYTVIQQPGSDNSLGIIKFEFPNPFSVYVHDTPSKSLFNQTYRSYSHGCMRCENPIELAKVMLQYDSLGKKGNPITGDSLDSLLSLQTNHPLRLLTPVPIFIEYQTVVADRQGIYFHHDLYSRETSLVKILLNGK
jgi:peptidoglycan hydrolase-like protein with peptidoglycan-binding domain